MVFMDSGIVLNDLSMILNGYSRAVHPHWSVHKISLSNIFVVVCLENKVLFCLRYCFQCNNLLFYSIILVSKTYKSSQIEYFSLSHIHSRINESCEHIQFTSILFIFVVFLLVVVVVVLFNWQNIPRCLFVVKKCSPLFFSLSLSLLSFSLH